MTDLNIPALKAAALAATPGPWKSALATVKSIPAECVIHVDPERTWSAEYEPGWETVCRWKADAAFIALANPTTVLALIERLERAEAVAEYARSREMPTTEKQVEAAEMFFTAPMRARLEKLEAIEKLAQRVRQERDDYSHGDFADDVLAALEAP